MHWKRIIFSLVLIVLMGVWACARPTPTPTPAAPAPGPTPTPVATPGVVATPRPTPTPPLALKPSGELRVALSALGTEALDPILGPTYNIIHLSMLFDHLVGWAPKGAFEPSLGLASKWERSPDALTWTLYLRQGVKFHNGEEVTAEDAKFSLERAIGPRSVASFAATLKAEIKEVEAPERYKLVVRAKRPSPFLHYYFSRALGGNEGMVVPRKYIQEKGEDNFAINPIGSGPYRLVKHEPGSYMRFEALENHWQMGVPKYKGLTFFAVPEETTRMALLRLGQADIIGISRERGPEAKKLGFELITQPASAVVDIHFPQQWQKEWPTGSPKVREALDLAINREEIVKFIFQGFARPLANDHFITSIAVEYDQALKPRAYNVERAKALLAEAGYTKGFEIDLYTFPNADMPEATPFTEAIAGFWDKIGVKAKIIPLEYSVVRTRWIRQAFEKPTAHYLIHSARPVNAPLLALLHRSDSNLRITQMPDVLDKMIDDAASEIDEAKYLEKMRKLGRFLHDLVAVAAPFELDRVVAKGPRIGAMDLGTLQYELNLRQFIAGK